MFGGSAVKSAKLMTKVQSLETPFTRLPCALNFEKRTVINVGVVTLTRLSISLPITKLNVFRIQEFVESSRKTFATE